MGHNKYIECSTCLKSVRSDVIRRHYKSCIKSDKCPICQKPVDDDFQNHIDQCGRKTYGCDLCGEKFNTGIRRTAHQRKCKSINTPHRAQGGSGIRESSALNGLFRIIEIKPRSNSFDYEVVLLGEISRITEILKMNLKTRMKFYLSVEVNMVSHDVSKLTYFQSENSLLDKSTDIENEVQRHITEIFTQVDEYVQHGSGWVMENVHRINIMITRLP